MQEGWGNTHAEVPGGSGSEQEALGPRAEEQDT